MEIIRIVLVLLGIALLVLAGLKKGSPNYEFGWLGLAVLAIVFLIQFVVVRV